MKKLFFASSALILAGIPFAAQAEDWTVEGNVAGSVGTTENVLASAANETSDTVYGLSGKLVLSTEGDGGSFSVFGSANLTRYADVDDENSDDFTVGAKGSINFDGGSVFAGASHALNTEDRREVTARRDTLNPTEFTVDSFDAGFRTRLGGVAFLARVNYETSDYEDGRNRITNAPIDQDFRDRGVWTQTFRVTGSPDADVSVFGQVSFTQVDYDLEPPASLHDRDSEGYTASLGATFDMTDEVTGEISVGWSGRSFDSAVFDDVSDVVVDASLTLTPSPQTTIVLSASRDFEESTTPLSPIMVSTAVGFNVTYDVTPNFQVAAYVSQSWDDHENRDRLDTTGNAGVSVAFRVAPNAEITGAYDFSTQDSDGIHGVPGYDDGRLTLGFKIGF